MCDRNVRSGATSTLPVLKDNAHNPCAFVYRREGILVGCGNPLLDISAIVPMDFLKKYAMKEDDAILAEERHMPIYQELVDGFQAEFLAGGSVQNSLRIAQWILGQPKVAVFFGCVGEDKYAEILAEKARAAGLDVHYQVKKDVPTGTCAVLITGTHRSLCANLAAANHFTIDHLRSPKTRRWWKTPCTTIFR